MLCAAAAPARDGRNVTHAHRWLQHLRGHLLLFDVSPLPELSSQNGVRLLLTAALIELIRVSTMRWLHVSLPLWVFLPGLLALAVVLVPEIAKVTFSQLGLRPWRDWTTTEKSYFVQVLLIANVVFPAMLAMPIAKRVEAQGVFQGLWQVFVPYLFFGFYQELVYRGLVQRELARRWGAPIGVVVANVLYTFGPLHWNYFASPPSVRWPMFAGIFAIGLYFGAVYQRSGNLGMVGIFHAIGNAYMIWGSGSAR